MEEKTNETSSIKNVDNETEKKHESLDLKKLENGEAVGSLKPSPAEVPMMALQAPSTKLPETPGSKAELPPRKENVERKKSIVGGKGFRLPRFSRLNKIIQNHPKEFKSKVFVLFLFAVIIVGVPLIWFYYNKNSNALEEAKRIRFDEATRIWKIKQQNGYVSLTAKLGKGIPPRIIPTKCLDDFDIINQVCLVWIKHALLVIDYRQIDDISCYDVHWRTPTENMFFTDSFYFEDAHWYGGGEYATQNWPLETNIFDDTWFITSDIEQNEKLGAFLESYWLSSKGVALKITSERPLKMKLEANNRSLSISSPVIKQQGHDSTYNYTICVAENITRIHEFMLDQFFVKPRESPNEIIFEKPIWSTFGRYRDNFSQQDIVHFVEEIQQYNFDRSYFLFENGWQNTIGDFEFSPQRFDDPLSMTSLLVTSGFIPAVVIYPQFDVRSEYFKHCVLNDFAVRDSGNVTAGLTKWRKGVAAIVDPSYFEAVKWYVSLVTNFKNKTNITSVAFKGGVVSNLPHESWSHDYTNEINHLTTSFIDMISQVGDVFAVGSGWRTQHLPLIVSISSRTATWSLKQGLKSVIPTVLNLGLIGYQFILPDVIGGHISEEEWNNGTRKPDRELYIRWVQLASFMPFMKFSLPPWDYDDEVVNITLTFLNLRKNVILPKLKSALSDSMNRGYPLIRPLWWIAPLDKKALKISNQFMLGQSLMIAPILSNHKTSRDIYLPPGEWYDELRKVQYTGGNWLTNYTTSFYEVAYFSYL